LEIAMNPLETIFINTWNRIVGARSPRLEGGLPLGHLVMDERVTAKRYFLPTQSRLRHVVIQGKTGSGKSFSILSIAFHDVDAARGFALFDLHGDLIPQILAFIAQKHPDYAARLVLIDPANPEYAVGLNPLEVTDEYSRFREVAEITRSLADRWDFKGARTEELLRNTLYALSVNGLTILEAALFLSNDDYRSALLKKVSNQDVLEYFELRFNPVSDAMKATMREPVLNKLSEFTADPHFRYNLGQRHSTFSFDEVLSEGKIVLVNLNKGRLGIHSTMFGSLILAKLKAAIFRRQKRQLFSIFADEMQNLAASDTDFEVLFSEARKFGVGIVTANQFSAQLPQTIRSAVQAIGTRVFFQLSPEDAGFAAQELDGGKTMAERLRNLKPRHAYVKSGHYAAQEIVTPNLEIPNAPTGTLIQTSNSTYARLKTAIDADIRARRPKPESSKEAIHDWD
jgi:hypothetical protein